MARPEATAAAVRPRVRLAVATVLGIGYAPVAPGTVGSVPAVLLYALLVRTAGPAAVLVALALAIVAGFWSAGAAERHLGRRDPRPVVIDEVAGQLVALLFLPATWPTLLASFLAFRLFDILKPFPARRLEALPGGSGIMADDLMAGVYANLVVQFAVWLLPGWFGA